MSPQKSSSRLRAACAWRLTLTGALATHLLACGAGLLVGQGRLVLTRRRVGGVLLSALLVGLLTFFRKPVDTEWATSTGLLLAAIAALLLAVHLLGTRLAALVALLATLVLTGWAVLGLTAASRFFRWE